MPLGDGDDALSSLNDSDALDSFSDGSLDSLDENFGPGLRGGKKKPAYHQPKLPKKAPTQQPGFPLCFL